MSGGQVHPEPTGREHGGDPERPRGLEDDGVDEPEAHWAGIGPIAPRPGEDLDSLIAWLRTGRAAQRRIDFTAGTVLPDGRLDLCKQAVGPLGAQRVLEALPDAPRALPVIKHLLLGTDGLGDQGAETVAAAAGPKGLETLYLGCNNVGAGGVCRMADSLRASPRAAVGAVWLKRNPLGPAGGEAAAELLDAVKGLRTLDLVQTGLDAAGVAVLVDALITASGTGRDFERVYLGGNALGVEGAASLARLVAAGGVAELYASAARLGSEGAQILAEALESAPPDRLRRISVASNGIGAAACARLVAAAARAGVQLLDLGHVRAARVMAAPENRIDQDAAAAIGSALADTPHRLSHLVLTDTGMRSREALSLLRALGAADGRPWAIPAAPRTPAPGGGPGPAPIRIVLGKGVAATVKTQFAQLAAGAAHPAAAPDVAAIRSVHRTAPPARSDPAG